MLTKEVKRKENQQRVLFSVQSDCLYGFVFVPLIAGVLLTLLRQSERGQRVRTRTRNGCVTTVSLCWVLFKDISVLDKIALRLVESHILILITDTV